MRTVAVACGTCLEDLIYVLVDDQEQPVEFVSPWFGCPCNPRRVTFHDMYGMADTAIRSPAPDGLELVGYAVHGLRVEPWTAPFTPRRRRTR